MALDKKTIIAEIKRTARENGGVPLGVQRFRTATGIGQYDWYGIFWKSWGEAQLEAGFSPSSMQGALPEEYLLQQAVELITDLETFPVRGDFLLRHRRDPKFPSADVFWRRFGSKRQLASKILEYCRKQGGLEEIVALCLPQVGAGKDEESQSKLHDKETLGSVYLVKYGKDYKIGRTNSAGRRKYELDTKLPEQSKLVHEIKTDDPVGIEEYWHKRFAAVRGNGEWFRLSSANVAAFKRRKFM